MTNKTTLQRFKLDPYFSETIETNLNVWSHDQNSYEIKFEFYDNQCEKPIDLTGADMRILLDHEGSQPKIYPLEVESKILGLAKFIMPEQIRGCEGKFTAHIYADYPNKTHDFGSFTFYTQLSKIDKSMDGCLDTVYVSEFEKALKKVEEFEIDINNKVNSMNEEINKVNEQITDNDIVKKTELDKEINIVKQSVTENSNNLEVLTESVTENSNNLEVLTESVADAKKLSQKGFPHERGVMYIAHRGNHTWFPENSLDAFSQVRSHQGIETDIQTTKDGEWIVMHDLTVDRTTNGTGKVKEKTLEEVRSLELKGADWYKKLENSKMVPTFKEFLAVCKEKNKMPIIEIKGSGYTNEEIERLKDNIEQYYQSDEVVIISFDINNLKSIREKLPEVHVMLLHEHLTKDLIDEVHSTFKYKCSMNVNHGNINDETKDMITYAHSLGMKVGFWTVHYEAMKNLISLGADFITTDDESSKLKVGKVSLENSFRENQSTFLSNNKVIQKENGTVFLKLSLEGGSNAAKTQVGSLPDWAVPTKSTYVSAVCRTSSGVSLVTLDVIGKNNPADSQQKPGAILTGLGWEQRTTWVDLECIYDLY